MVQSLQAAELAAGGMSRIAVHGDTIIDDWDTFVLAR